MSKVNKPTKSIEEGIEELFPKLIFRKYQKEAIIEIIKTYLDNPKCKIMVDAPTGSGKSIIAMVVSKYLSEFLDKRGYILTSDTYLQDQYARDAEKLGLGYVSIKGKDNYKCSLNDLKFSLGVCETDNVKGKDRKKLDCYPTCPYYYDRNKAIVSDVCILNYHYWIIHQNVNKESERNVTNFGQRDFVFFDESHKSVGIVNDYFALNISENVVRNIHNIIDLLKINDSITDNSYEYFSHNIDSCIGDLLSDGGDDFENLKRLSKVLEKAISLENPLKEINKKLSGNYITEQDEDEVEVESITLKISKLPEQNKRALRSYNSIDRLHGQIKTYIDIVEFDYENLIIRDKMGSQVKFYCSDMSLLMEQHFHDFYKAGIYMSATFLNNDFFVRYANMDDVKIIKIPNTFDFSNSPIYYNKNFSMSYKNRDFNIGPQCEEIDDIVDKYESGIIHTGSYKNSIYLRDNSHHTKNGKIRFYTNTEEKKELVKELMLNKDFFLAGPSLLEGIDLKDDISRCQIFMKIPYLTLASTFVKEKMKTDRKWYMWETSLNFVQGMGRSNRNKNDYCDTYILDSSFDNLIRSRMIPTTILERIEVYD